jgi:hypothetical protein
MLVGRTWVDEKYKWRIDAAFLGSFPFLKFWGHQTNEHGNRLNR